MLPEGNYPVKKVVSCFLGESAEKKTPYVSIEFLLNNDTAISWINYLTEKTDHNKFIETMANIGFIGKELSDLADDSIDVDLLFVKPQEEYSVTIEHETFTDKNGNHKTKARVKWINFANSTKKMNINEARNVFNKFGLESLWSKKNESTPF